MFTETNICICAKLINVYVILIETLLKMIVNKNIIYIYVKKPKNKWIELIQKLINIITATIQS